LKDGLLGIFRGTRYTGYGKVGTGAARPYVLSRRGSAPSYLGTLHPHGPVVTILASSIISRMEPWPRSKLQESPHRLPAL